MKRIALNRKNCLFVGNEAGGRTAAILSGFTSTCRRHGTDPQICLTQLMTNLPGTPVSQLDQWLPDRWTLPAKDLCSLNGHCNTVWLMKESIGRMAGPRTATRAGRFFDRGKASLKLQ